MSDQVTDVSESKHHPQNVMFSKRVWIVPMWMKTIMVMIFFGLIFGLTAFSVDKRLTMAQLAMDNVLEPEWVSPGQATTLPFEAYQHTANGILRQAGQQTFSDFKGQWVLLNLWATWCEPCRDEMPALEMLQRRFKDRLTVLTLSVDDEFEAVGHFFKDEDGVLTQPPTFRLGHDRDKKVAADFGSRKFPETFLIDPSGQVVTQFIGPKDWYSAGSVNYFENVLTGQRAPQPTTR